jgi:hypothetical protein
MQVKLLSQTFSLFGAGIILSAGTAAAAEKEKKIKTRRQSLVFVRATANA